MRHKILQLFKGGMVLALIAFSSCGKDFLEPKPLSSFVPENTYVNKEAMTTLLNSCRHKLKQEFINDNPLLCTEYNISDIAVPGETAPQSLKNLDEQLTPYGAGNSKILDNSDSSGETSYWAVCWGAVKSANTVITRHILATYKSEDEKNMVLAEGYFHRAYWYYRIVNQYGDVPYIGEEILTPKVDLVTASRKSILKQMKTDMMFAVKWLPAKPAFGEVSKYAGYHLLAKIYLALGEFDNAIEAASEVIDKSHHQLMKVRFGKYKNDGIHDVIWDLFRKENISISENTEGILVGQDRVDSRNNGSSSGGTERTRQYGPFWLGVPGMIRSGEQYQYLLRGIARTRPSYYMSYGLWDNAGNDKRHTWPNWFPLDSLKYNDPSKANYGQYVDKSASTDTIRQWFPFQHYKIVVPDEVRDPLTNNDSRGGFSDIYIFRLAETYLLRAEAYVWKNRKDLAVKDVNEVRGRAGATLAAESEIDIDYILDERARELYVEEPRKTELTRITFIMADQKLNGYSTDNMHQKNFYYDRVMRTNNYFSQQVVAGGVAFKMSSYHYLWPIPQKDIKANVSGHINQNLGYSGSENNKPPVEF